MRRIFVNPWRNDTEHRSFSQNADSDIVYRVDFSKCASARGTSVSSVAWTSDESLTVADESLTSGVADGTVSGTNYDKGTVRVTATFANGDTEVQLLSITVDDR